MTPRPDETSCSPPSSPPEEFIHHFDPQREQLRHTFVRSEYGAVPTSLLGTIGTTFALLLAEGEGFEPS